MADNKPDVKLADGREVTVDLSKITVKEYRAMHNAAFSDDTDAELLKKITGIEIDDISMNDLRKIITAVIKKASNPLADPS